MAGLNQNDALDLFPRERKKLAEGKSVGKLIDLLSNMPATVRLRRYCGWRPREIQAERSESGRPSGSDSDDAAEAKAIMIGCTSTSRCVTWGFRASVVERHGTIADGSQGITRQGGSGGRQEDRQSWPWARSASTAYHVAGRRSGRNRVLRDGIHLGKQNRLGPSRPDRCWRRPGVEDELLGHSVRVLGVHDQYGNVHGGKIN